MIKTCPCRGSNDLCGCQNWPDGQPPAPDLVPTDVRVKAHPKVRAMVRALTPFYAAVFNDNGDVTISTGHLTTADWLKLAAAIRDMKGGAA